MDINDYQTKASDTAIYPPTLQLDGDDIPNIYYPAMGLCGEAGEVCNKIKKVMRDNGGRVTQAIRADMIGELGDVMWYVAELASKLGLELEDILAFNIAKLNGRKDRGTLTGSGDKR